MSDAMLSWGGDLTVNPNGDILLSTGSDLGQQRVLRRLLTNPDDYVWHSDYGAGLGQFVGGTTSQRQIVGMIKAQILEEEIVARQPSPVVSAEPYPGGSIFVNISYVDAQDDGTQSLSLMVGG